MVYLAMVVARRPGRLFPSAKSYSSLITSKFMGSNPTICRRHLSSNSANPDQQLHQAVSAGANATMNEAKPSLKSHVQELEQLALGMDGFCKEVKGIKQFLKSKFDTQHDALRASVSDLSRRVTEATDEIEKLKASVQSTSHFDSVSESTMRVQQEMIKMYNREIEKINGEVSSLDNRFHSIDQIIGEIPEMEKKFATQLYHFKDEVKKAKKELEQTLSQDLVSNKDEVKKIGDELKKVSEEMVTNKGEVVKKFGEELVANKNVVKKISDEVKKINEEIASNKNEVKKISDEVKKLVGEEFANKNEVKKISDEVKKLVGEELVTNKNEVKKIRDEVKKASEGMGTEVKKVTEEMVTNKGELKKVCEELNTNKDVVKKISDELKKVTQEIVEAKRSILLELQDGFNEKFDENFDGKFDDKFDVKFNENFGYKFAEKFDDSIDEFREEITEDYEWVSEGMEKINKIFPIGDEDPDDALYKQSNPAQDEIKMSGEEMKKARILLLVNDDEPENNLKQSDDEKIDPKLKWVPLNKLNLNEMRSQNEIRLGMTRPDSVSLDEKLELLKSGVLGLERKVSVAMDEIFKTGCKVMDDHDYKLAPVKDKVESLKAENEKAQSRILELETKLSSAVEEMGKIRSLANLKRRRMWRPRRRNN